jgi:hypothetical protein
MPYQVLFLGADDGIRDRLRARLREGASELGLPADMVDFLDEGEAGGRDRRSPLIAVFFGSRGHARDTALLQELLEDSIVIIPLVSSLERVREEVPPRLRHVNALETGNSGVGRASTLVLEAFRLLRRDRKLFISYRRADAQPFAERLYNALDARGFDVFIDVRSVPPAVDFQSELWHRMSDSDVVILVDTPGFRESRWTVEELARANATNIQILHLLWPGQREDDTSSFSHFMRLTLKDFGRAPGRGGTVKSTALARICDAAEGLRARAMSARYRYLVDNFCDAARDLGMAPVVQPEQWVSLDTKDKDGVVAVVPAVGVPTSHRINEIFDAVAKSALNARDVWVIYDNRGVLDTWLAHLDWLDEHLPLRTIRMAQAPALLRELLS